MYEEMMISNFEEFIDGIIVDRGLVYYENGHVTDLIEEENNCFAATVEGSEENAVEVSLDENGEILDCYCDCPYDWGEYCKHEVAVFYALRNLKGSKKKRKKAKGKKQSLGDIINGLDKEELIKIILELAKDSEIKNALLMKYSTGDDEVAACKNLITSSLRKIKGDFISWDEVGDAVVGAEKVLTRMETIIREGRTETAVKIALALLKEMMDLLDCCDDSDGIVGSVIGQGVDLLREAIEYGSDKRSAEISEELFQSVTHEAASPRYHGWTDLRFDLLETCIPFCCSQDRRASFDVQLNKILPEEPDSWSAKYYNSRIEMIRYKIIKRFDTPQQSEAFIQDHLKYSEFRELAVNHAFDNENYQSVIRLCLDGENQDSNSRGLLLEWKTWRFRAYERLGDIGNQRDLALWLLYQNKYEYYAKLKTLYNEYEWPSVLVAIYQAFEKITNPPEVYIKILIEEERPDKLLIYCKKNLSRILDLYPNIITDYKNETNEIFNEFIARSSAQAANRRDYQRVCGIIRTCKKACGKAAATAIIQELKMKYSRRPAFLDELSKI